MSDLSSATNPPALLRPILLCLVTFGSLVMLATVLAGGTPDLSRLGVAMVFFAFGLLAQSGYASIFLMEPSFANRMSHAVGFSLWVTAFLLVLWWFDGSAFPAGILGLIALAALMVPVSYLTFRARVRPNVLVDRSTLARGTPGMDEVRWILALVIFAAAVAFDFLMAETVNPLFLAFWALFACALLSPTLDVEQPRWLLRLRDAALLATGGLCVWLVMSIPA